MRIETSTRCHCGTHVTLIIRGAIDALCPRCYDGTEDAGETAHVKGHGETPESALWDWQEKHDEAWGVEVVVTDMFGDLARQVREEAERTRGWRLKPDFDINHSRSEFIYGPEGA